MKNKAINIKDLEKVSPLFRGRIGNRFAEYMMHFLAIDKINELYDHSFDYKGAEFASRLLNDLGVYYRIGNIDRLKNSLKGGFISISNHPYGGLDGIMLIDLMAGIRPDYKFMVNKVLSLIKTMDENFISVTPVTTKKPEISENISSIRETLIHLREGHPVGVFPSGAVSDFSIKDFRVRDREWQESVLKLIKMAKVPIVPIRFFDKNSPFFYLLGLINWRIRLLRMPSEVFNKKNQRPRIGIGEIITVEEQEQFNDISSFGFFLRRAVYDMPLPESFTPRGSINLLGEKTTL